MHSVGLVLTNTGSRVSRFLGFFTKARYNHVSISVSCNLDEFYSFGRRVLWFPLIGGFVVEHIDKGMYKLFRNTDCVIYKLEIDDYKYYELCKKIEGYKENSKIYKYNLPGLIGVLIGIPIRMRNRYFCSQFVANLFHECAIYNFGKDPSLVTPDEFHSIPGLKIIYNGMLSEMPGGEIHSARRVSLGTSQV